MAGNMPADSCGEVDSFRTLGSHFRSDQAHLNDGILPSGLHEDEAGKALGNLLKQMNNPYSTENILMSMRQAEIMELKDKEDEIAFMNGAFRTAEPFHVPQDVLEETWSKHSGLQDDFFERFSSKQANGNQQVFELSEAMENITINDFPSFPDVENSLHSRFMPHAPDWSHNILDVHDFPFLGNRVINEDAAALGMNSNIFEEQVEDEVQRAAAELADSVSDQELKDTKFMTFMQNLKSGAATIQSGEVLGNPFADLEDSASAVNPSTSFSQEESVTSMDSILDKIRDSLSNNSTMSWNDQELSHMRDPFQEYEFAENNPMKGQKNALEEGKKRLLAGDLPSAVLCFECAVQMEPENAEAWLLLGTTQAENEQDPSAIPALKKCLELDEGNLTALMALGVCYTNEDLEYQACEALKNWLLRNPKYSDIIQDSPSSSSGASNIRTETGFIKEVQSFYMEAARRSPGKNLDPDVQSGLGVLFNLTNEHEKAVDCFKAALSVRDKDARLWNRLGATLANGSRSEEAVRAYRQALVLSPGFVRARYNLGVTCVNLTAYKEAAEHFLSALNQQAVASDVDGNTPHSTTSKSIWSALKMVFAMLDRQDLYQAIENQDLARLNSEFGLQSSR